MLRSLLCLIAISAFSVSAFAETKFNLHGDAYVRAYMKNAKAGADTHAFNQFFRLNVDAKPDENLTVKTGLVLSSNTWEGDNHNGTAAHATTGGTNDDAFGKSSVTRLDHAQIEYAKNGWITSVGRMAVTSPGSFLTSDDRRDRVQVVKMFANFHALALVYDKRAEGSLTNKDDDLDMYSVNYYGATEDFKFALQSGYWRAKKYALATSGFNGLNLDEVKQFTPQFETTLAGVTLNLYYTLLMDGNGFYNKTHHSGALKLSKDFEVVKLEAQSMITVDGGLIAGGFDSLSSVINNSPDHNQSSIKLRTIGFGLGSDLSDESFHALRASKKINEEISASIGGGYGIFFVAGNRENNTVVDASTRYEFSKNLALTALYGRFFGDYKDSAASLNLNATF